MVGFLFFASSCDKNVFVLAKAGAGSLSWLGAFYSEERRDVSLNISLSCCDRLLSASLMFTLPSGKAISLVKRNDVSVK